MCVMRDVLHLFSNSLTQPLSLQLLFLSNKKTLYHYPNNSFHPSLHLPLLQPIFRSHDDLKVGNAPIKWNQTIRLFPEEPTNINLILFLLSFPFALSHMHNTIVSYPVLAWEICKKNDKSPWKEWEKWCKSESRAKGTKGESGQEG